jgi:hypothetical protein
MRDRDREGERKSGTGREGGRKGERQTGKETQKRERERVPRSEERKREFQGTTFGSNPYLPPNLVYAAAHSP